MPFTEHTIESLSNEVKLSADGKLRDAQSMFIEEVGLTDNLRLYGYIHASSKRLVIKQAPANKPFTYLVGFEKCLIAAKKMQTG